MRDQFRFNTCNWNLHLKILAHLTLRGSIYFCFMLANATKTPHFQEKVWKKTFYKAWLTLARTILNLSCNQLCFYYIILRALNFLILTILEKLRNVILSWNLILANIKIVKFNNRHIHIHKITKFKLLL